MKERKVLKTGGQWELQTWQQDGIEDVTDRWKNENKLIITTFDLS